MPDLAEPLERSVTVTDDRALEALSHPLRNRSLGVLRLDGPSTATRLGRRVGESSGSTSHHLRRLEAYGSVEEVRGHDTGRERWWRARHRMTCWRAEDLLAQEEGAQVQVEMTRLQLDGHARLLQAWLAQRDQRDPAWATAASLDDPGLRLAPDEARQLAHELDAVLDRWLQAHPAQRREEGTEIVSVLLDLVPLRRWPV